MASASYVKTLFGGVDATIRRALDQAWDHILDGGLRLGRPVHEQRAENVQAYFYQTTTPSIANEEFSIAHGLGRVPYLIQPVMPTVAGEQMVRLAVPRDADAMRVYLSSPDTDAPVTILLEG